MMKLGFSVVVFVFVVGCGVKTTPFNSALDPELPLRAKAIKKVTPKKETLLKDTRK